MASYAKDAPPYFQAEKGTALTRFALDLDSLEIDHVSLGQAKESYFLAAIARAREGYLDYSRF